MCITITDIIGKYRIDVAYLIRADEVAVVSLFSDNDQYLLKGPMKVLLKTGEEKEIPKGMNTDKVLSALIGLEKSKLFPHDYAFKKNKLEHVTEMVISLDELDNTDNLENGRPSNDLFRLSRD